MTMPLSSCVTSTRAVSVRMCHPSLASCRSLPLIVILDLMVGSSTLSKEATMETVTLLSSPRQASCERCGAWADGSPGA
uniref:Uncharacterized protein n=1 Tax=Mandrillus leucophaeus TaxID=9568 RepID=A0A2K5Y7J3_MANLE